jgi:hypothetical protein
MTARIGFRSCDERHQVFTLDMGFVGRLVCSRQLEKSAPILGLA